jgi:hypothetical protein
LIPRRNRLGSYEIVNEKPNILCESQAPFLPYGKDSIHPRTRLVANHDIIQSLDLFDIPPGEAEFDVDRGGGDDGEVCHGHVTLVVPVIGKEFTVVSTDSVVTECDDDCVGIDFAVAETPADWGELVLLSPVVDCVIGTATPIIEAYSIATLLGNTGRSASLHCTVN